MTFIQKCKMSTSENTPNAQIVLIKTKIDLIVSAVAHEKNVGKVLSMEIDLGVTKVEKTRKKKSLFNPSSK